MKKIVMLAASVAVMASLSACSITLPVAATANPVGSRVGTSSGMVFLGIFAFGADASIRSAAKNGGITKVSTVDLKRSNILMILDTYECIVSGD